MLYIPKSRRLLTECTMEFFFKNFLILVSEKLLNLLSSYICGRKQSVKVGNYLPKLIVTSVAPGYNFLVLLPCFYFRLMFAVYVTATKSPYIVSLKSPYIVSLETQITLLCFFV